MKKKTAIFLTALLLLCMVIPAFAEQAVTFPQGTITSEPIELFSEHFACVDRRGRVRAGRPDGTVGRDIPRHGDGQRHSL